MADSQEASRASSRSGISRVLRLFRPSHEHSAYSATVLLMSAIMLSRVLGFVREMYIAWAFGAGPATDAYVAGFTIPDWLNYLVAGGAASITFISIYTRFMAEDKEDEAQKTFSIIITVMTSVLIVGVIVTEFFTPQICRWWFNGFKPEQLELCVYLTRILLPAQIFFYIGGVVSAVLLSRRMFLFPALGPILYNVFIILGGILFSHRLGIASLAYGAVAGQFVGPFLINAIGAAWAGTGFSVSFDISNPAFREWVKLSIPLMLGFSLVSADDWILRHFASGSSGDITRLNYAKRLFTVPIAVLGQATGQASLPFFAKLFGEKKMQEFADTVNGSVYRIAAGSLLLTSLMTVTALPLCDLAYRRGRFAFSDSRETAMYFLVFSLSLAFWAAQALYARAFYAAGDTLTPMVASTVVVAASLPVYSVLHRMWGTPGLALASDVGIAGNTLVTAVLLHYRKLVPGDQLQWKEIGKALLIALGAAVPAYYVGQIIKLTGSRVADLENLLLVGSTWAAATAVGIWLTRSRIINDLQRRKPKKFERAAESQMEVNQAGTQP